MKTLIFRASSLIIILIASLALVHFAPLHARADTPTDPDDPTATYYCSQDLDADGNPIQDCTFGHFVQDCEFEAEVESCSQDFQPDAPTDAELFAPIAQQLASGTSFALTASWNGTPLSSASTPIALRKSGTLSWNYTPSTLQTPSHGPQSFSDALSTATLTLDLYKGVMGSSTLVFSQTVSSSTLETIPVSFDSTGPYFLAFSATYPGDTHPPRESPADVCANANGDFCPIPIFSLHDFQNVMTQGDNLMEQSNDALGNYIPAAYGLLPFTLDAASTNHAGSNVLFLPGMIESRLYMKTSLGEHRVWEPMLDTDVAALAMNPDGTSKNGIYTRDVMDHLYSDNPTVASLVKNAAGDSSVMYGPFEDFMNGLVANGTIKEWEAYPYDWRYDVSDIVKNGTLVGTATSTPVRVYLQNVVQELASSSPTGKVTIVAHSNGGLLAKALAVELQKEGELGLLDRLILVGTPQLGTPETIGGLLHADNQTEALGIVMYSGTFRSVALNSPGAYGLLPSTAYFNTVSTPVVSFASDTLDAAYQKQYGATINSYSKMLSFLTNVGNTRTVPSPTDLITPAVASSADIQKAKATHDVLDTWTPPDSVPVTSIVDWGQPTIQSYSYSSQPFGFNCSFSGFLQIKCGSSGRLEHVPTKTNAGDNTVIVPSANFMGNVLYLNAQKLRAEGEGNFVHQNLLSAAAVQNQIKNLLTNTSTTDPDLQTSEPSPDNSSMLVVGVHSPMNVVATDANGNKTGIVPVVGFPDFYFTRGDIPGSSIDTIDDEKYVYLPSNGSYTFSLQGYAEGESTVTIGQTDVNGNITTTQTFADIPTTASTTGSFSVSGATASAPAIDTNGDGKVDLVASSSVSNTSSASMGQLMDQFSSLRGRYGAGSLLLISLQKLLLQKTTTDFQNACALLQKAIGAHIGDILTPQQATDLLQATQKLRL